LGNGGERNDVWQKASGGAMDSGKGRIGGDERGVKRIAQVCGIHRLFR
jgi:hypothetical protein